MATVNCEKFNWLKSEVELIKSKRFHVFEPLSGDDLCYELNGDKFQLRGDYAEFLREFGWAKLFMDYNDSPDLMVYPLKSYRRHFCGNGNTYIAFGDRRSQHVCFDEQVILDGGQSKVYSVTKNKAVELYPGFLEWLLAAYDWIKSKYSNRQWHAIADGPKPFSDSELEIVKARQRFRWRHIGFSENGDAMFEVVNFSNKTLPYLSIGVRDVDQKILIGGAWLNVGDIGPGDTGVVFASCYKGIIPPDKLDVFEFPEPIPEKREAYWELGKPE